MDFESLKAAIQTSTQQIDPYNWVSFRILHQMANLLQNQYPAGTYEAFGQRETEDSLLLIKSYQSNLEIKKTYENRFWEARPPQIIDVDRDALIKEMKMHHKVFTKKQGVKHILRFLTAQNNEVENWFRLNGDPAIDHAGSQEKHPIFGRGLKYKLRKRFLKARVAIDPAKNMDQDGMIPQKEGGTRKPKGKKGAQAAEMQEKPTENREQAMRILLR